MKTLIEQIKEVKHEISQLEHIIKEHRYLLTKLENDRAYCDHDWDSGVKHYEHEGVFCKKCGINDMFAATLKKQLESKK